jgi:AcrR family transcriptional regulator
MTESANTASDLAPSRPGKYSQGSKTVETILQAALHVLIEEGSGAFTLRRIAAQCDLQVGNVSRHFPRKEMLVQVLLDELLTSSEERLKRGVYETKMSPEDALALVIAGTLEDIETKRITRLITELWAMSNHNDFVAERVEALYRYVHNLIGSFVKQLNPLLDADQVETVALYINATMEGTTALAGFGKPWASKMPFMKTLSVKWLITMVKTITPDELQNLRIDGRVVD